MEPFKDINDYVKYIIFSLQYDKAQEIKMLWNITLNLLNIEKLDKGIFEIDTTSRKVYDDEKYDNFLDSLRHKCINLKSDEIRQLLHLLSIEVGLHDKYGKFFHTDYKCISSDIIKWLTTTKPIYYDNCHLPEVKDEVFINIEKIPPIDIPNCCKKVHKIYPYIWSNTQIFEYIQTSNNYVLSVLSRLELASNDKLKLYSDEIVCLKNKNEKLEEIVKESSEKISDLENRIKLLEDLIKELI